jgi:hypothetical protein
MTGLIPRLAYSGAVEDAVVALLVDSAKAALAGARAAD